MLEDSVAGESELSAFTTTSDSDFQMSLKCARLLIYSFSDGSGIFVSLYCSTYLVTSLCE